MSTDPRPQKITPPWNPKHNSMWLVWYECRMEVVHVFITREGFHGFFAPGQDALWGIGEAEPIMEIIPPTAPTETPEGGEAYSGHASHSKQREQEEAENAALQTAPAESETPDAERIGGWRITSEGLKMNGPTPPTQEETQAYLAHERADLIAANEKLDNQLAGMSKAFDELRAHVVRAEEDNAALRRSLAEQTALAELLREALVASNTWLYEHHNIEGQTKRRELNEATLALTPAAALTRQQEREAKEKKT